MNDRNEEQKTSTELADDSDGNKIANNRGIEILLEFVGEIRASGIFHDRPEECIETLLHLLSKAMKSSRPGEIGIAVSFVTRGDAMNIVHPANNASDDIRLLGGMVLAQQAFSNGLAGILSGQKPS